MNMHNQCQISQYIVKKPFAKSIFWQTVSKTRLSTILERISKPQAVNIYEVLMMKCARWIVQIS